jgi:hypothetical protein
VGLVDFLHKRKNAGSFDPAPSTITTRYVGLPAITATAATTWTASTATAAATWPTTAATAAAESTTTATTAEAAATWLTLFGFVYAERAAVEECAIHGFDGFASAVSAAHGNECEAA